MQSEVFHGTVIVVHGPRQASTQEWNEHVIEYLTRRVSGVLVVTDINYPGPTPVQRAMANAAGNKHGHYPPIAVVTASPIHRGAVIVLGWMQKGNFTAYSPARLREAMAYARLQPEAVVPALNRVHELAARVGSTWIPRVVKVRDEDS